MKDESNPTLGHIISAIFLVAGTCIGGGMLALPVATGVSGFLPSTLVMLVCWLAMTISALFLLEANLWMKEGAHIITISSTILGPVGRWISWFVYLFICYASLVAYTAAGGSLIINSVESFFAIKMSKALACFLFIVVFNEIIYLGSQIVGRVNTILFLGMMIAYFALVGVGISEIQFDLLAHKKWITSFLAIPLLLTTFSFQTMLPSLTPYLKRNAKALRWAIIGGTTLTLCVYLLWQAIVMGIVPARGPNSLLDALEAGEPITQFLRRHVRSDSLSVIAEFFAFFALVTSFLGITLGLFDFLADGLKISKRGRGRWILSALIVLPTFIFATYFDRIFLVALDTSGGFGDAILNGIIPVLMVWVGRYILKYPAEHRTPGGKPLLIGIFLFFAGSLILEILLQTGMLCPIVDYCADLRSGVS